MTHGDDKKKQIICFLKSLRLAFCSLAEKIATRQKFLLFFLMCTFNSKLNLLLMFARPTHQLIHLIAKLFNTNHFYYTKATKICEKRQMTALDSLLFIRHGFLHIYSAAYCCPPVSVNFFLFANSFQSRHHTHHHRTQTHTI